MDTNTSSPQITINAVLNKPTNTIIAKTFTPSYNHKEDRIRLAINYSDYTSRVDFWITRSFLLKLIPATEEYLDTYDVIDTTKPEAAQEKKNHNASVATKSQAKTDSSTLTIMEKEATIATKSEITYYKSNNTFKLMIFGDNGVVVEANLSAAVCRAILKSIFSVAPKMSWGISERLMHD